MKVLNFEFFFLTYFQVLFSENGITQFKKSLLFMTTNDEKCVFVFLHFSMTFDDVFFRQISFQENFS